MCFCDDSNEKQGTICCGISVLSLQNATYNYSNAIYIVCVDETKRKGQWERETFNEMERKLCQCGVYDINSELRIIYYVYLLDIKNINMIRPRNRENMIKDSDINKILLFNHMSNSGSFFLEQLLDSVC